MTKKVICIELYNNSGISEFGEMITCTSFEYAMLRQTI